MNKVSRTYVCFSQPFVDSMASAEAAEHRSTELDLDRK